MLMKTAVTAVEKLAGVCDDEDVCVVKVEAATEVSG